MVMFTQLNQLEPETLMTALTPISHEQAATLSDWFQPERPAMIGLHALSTGQGTFLVDEWPSPRLLLMSVNNLNSMLGASDALEGRTLPIETGLMYCPDRFLPHLREQFATVNTIDRVALIKTDAQETTEPAGATVRRLMAKDAGALSEMSQELQFISNTWGGPAGLAESGYGWGAFVDGRLVSVAATFLLGNETEDLGVVTESSYRGRGLACACAARLCQDVRRRGRKSSWSTSTDNHASLRVAEKLGFKVWTHGSLYVLRSSE